MKPYLKLFRVPNVIMVGLTMLLMRYSIIQPFLSVYQMELKLPVLAFLCYVFATMLVAAAGYAINDYYDRNLDLLNRKPGDVVVGENIPASHVLSHYRILNIAAVVIAGYASYKAGVFLLIICYPIMIGLLFFYTTTYKKQLLIGNLIVSLASALVPVTIFLYEMPPVISHYKYYIISGEIRLNAIWAWIMGFAVFAFLSGLAREIVKDMEDFEGDKFMGRNTVPIVWGTTWAKGISAALLGIMIAGIAIVVYVLYKSNGEIDFTTLFYFLAFLILPLIYNIVKIINAKSVADYKFCGDLLKVIMLFGILYAPVVWYIIHKTFEL